MKLIYSVFAFQALISLSGSIALLRLKGAEAARIQLFILAAASAIELAFFDRLINRNLSQINHRLIFWCLQWNQVVIFYNYKIKTLGNRDAY
jgi:hypothetical protein